jgi:hypothetical protein
MMIPGIRAADEALEVGTSLDGVDIITDLNDESADGPEVRASRRYEP